MTNIAQIGCGYWGKNLTRNFAELGTLSHIVDGNQETAIAMQNAYGAEISTFDAVLANPNVDGVSLATPAETHGKLAIRALEAGKHVYVEKPISLTTAEAQNVFDTANRTDRMVMVGHLLQYHPVFIRLKSEIENGRIGDLRYVYSNRLSLGKFRLEENVLWSFAPHDISMMLSLVDAPVETVTAQSASFVSPGLADYATVQIEFENSVKGHIFASWLHPFKEHRLVAVGAEGMLVFEDSNPIWEEKLAFYNHKIAATSGAPVPEKATEEYLTVHKGEPLKNECQHFIDCIETGAPPRTDAKEALNVLRVLESAQNQISD